MTTEKIFKANSGKTATLIITENRLNSGKFTCYMRRTDTGKSVNASGNNRVEAYNSALQKIK